MALGCWRDLAVISRELRPVALHARGDADGLSRAAPAQDKQRTRRRVVDDLALVGRQGEQRLPVGRQQPPQLIVLDGVDAHRRVRERIERDSVRGRGPEAVRTARVGFQDPTQVPIDGVVLTDEPNSRHDASVGAPQKLPEQPRALADLRFAQIAPRRLRTRFELLCGAIPVWKSSSELGHPEN